MLNTIFDCLCIILTEVFGLEIVTVNWVW